MFWKTLFAFLFLFLQTETDDLKYVKEFYDSGKLRSEGWIAGGVKTKYWYYYHGNGNVKSRGDYKNDQKNGYWYFYDEKRNLTEEGHFKNDKASDWWILYKNEEVKIKMQFDNGMKNGFALIYKNGKLSKAERYEKDKFIGSWTSIAGFKRDNPNLSF